MKIEKPIIVKIEKPIIVSSAGDRGPVAGVGGRVGKSSKSGVSHGKGEGHVVHAGVNSVCNVCGSAHSCGRCVVNGSFARAAFGVSWPNTT